MKLFLFLIIPVLLSFPAKQNLTKIIGKTFSPKSFMYQDGDSISAEQARKIILEVKKNNSKSLTIENLYEAIPTELWQLTQLETLDLTGYRLRIIPEGLCNLKNLKSLNLSSTNLKKLPNSFGDLINLTDLDFSNCCGLPEFPESSKN